MTEQNSRQFVENPIFREIHKNTWLRRIHPSSSKKKREKLWVVFCVHNDTDPFLETYTDNKTAVFHKPKWFVPLNTVQHISPNLVPNEQEYEFVLTLSSDIVRLAAPSWDQMLDWVEGLKSKLLELKVLTPKENDIQSYLIGQTLLCCLQEILPLHYPLPLQCQLKFYQESKELVVGLIIQQYLQ